MLNPFALVTAAVVVVMVVLLFRTDDQLRRARILTWFGFGLTAAVSAFLLLFLVGESNVNEPGFVGMTAAWLLPIVVLGLAALLLPTIAVWILAAICVIEIAFGMWWYLDNTTWLDAMQGNGPASLADNPYRLLHLVVSN
ncbi:MAG TPA: hypothetical protein VFP34_09265, partial [Microlunatus sp.]|nr:hypothetical protein [Microlunatus sp.]